MNNDVQVFPARVDAGRPFDSAAAGVLWLREALEGAHGPITLPVYLTTPLGADQAFPVPQLTLTPHLAEPAQILPLTPGEPQQDYTAPDGSAVDPRMFELAYIKVAGGGVWPGRMPLALFPCGIREGLGMYRVAAGMEATVRARWQAIPKGRDRMLAAADLGLYEDAVTTADGHLVTAINALVFDLWRAALAAGQPVSPNPQTPGATSAGTSPSGTVRLGLTQ